MSKDEAMKLAIEVFKSATPKYTRQRKDQKTLGGALDYWRLEQHQKMKAIKALEETLKQEQGEPVAGVVMREGNPTLLRDKDIKPTDERLYTTPQQRKPLMLEKFREMKELLDDNPHQHKKIFTDDELKIIMETTMPVIDWKARYGVELNNGERNKWMLEWFIAFARAIEAAHGIKE